MNTPIRRPTKPDQVAPIPSAELSYQSATKPARNPIPLGVWSLMIAVICVIVAITLEVGKNRGAAYERAKQENVKSRKIEAPIATIPGWQEEHEKKHAEIDRKFEGFDGQIIGLLNSLQELAETTDKINLSINGLRKVLVEHRAAKVDGRKIINEIDAKRATL